MTDITSSPPSLAPDWQQFQGELRCPLCDYNLRGLSEPRCPECGYRFLWSELLERDLNQHPYLFEHHRNFRSFWRTAWEGWRPKKFWTRLKPTHPMRLRRLLAYWLICFALLGVAACMLVGCVAAFNWFISRSLYASARQVPPFDIAFIRRAIALDDLLMFPVWGWGIFGAWCCGTFASLMIFRGSMRRAKVKTSHVLRCVLYSFDVCLWVGLLMTILTATVLVCTYFVVPAFSLLPPAFVVWFLPLIVFIRLLRAYRHYLRFDHAVATILSSQVIVFLAILTLLMHHWWWPV